MLSAVGYAGEPDIPGIPSPRTLVPVGDGDTVFGLEIIAAPGHTPGSIVVRDPAGGLMVCVLLIALLVTIFSGLKAIGSRGYGPFAGKGYQIVRQALADSDDDEAPVAPAAYLPDMRMDPASRLEHQDSEEHGNSQLYAALEGLDERSKAILEARWLAEKKSTLHDLAEQFGVSAERIRQIEKQAMGKMKAQLAV